MTPSERQEIIKKLEDAFSLGNAVHATDSKKTISCYVDYHDSSCEIARLHLLNGFSRDYAMENLRAVFAEMVPSPALSIFSEDVRRDVLRKRRNMIKNDFSKYCEFIRVNGGTIPSNAVNVKYPHRY